MNEDVHIGSASADAHSVVAALRSGHSFLSPAAH